MTMYQYYTLNNGIRLVFRRNQSAVTHSGVYINRLLDGLYTPGSVFKIVTTAAVIKSGKNMSDWVYKCTGETVIDGVRELCSVYKVDGICAAHKSPACVVEGVILRHLKGAGLCVFGKLYRLAAVMPRMLVADKKRVGVKVKLRITVDTLYVIGVYNESIALMGYFKAGMT